MKFGDKGLEYKLTPHPTMLRGMYNRDDLIVFSTYYHGQETPDKVFKLEKFPKIYFYSVYEAVEISEITNGIMFLKFDPELDQVKYLCYKDKNTLLLNTIRLDEEEHEVLNSIKLSSDSMM